MPPFKDLIKKDQQAAWEKEVEKARLELQKKGVNDGNSKREKVNGTDRQKDVLSNAP